MNAYCPDCETELDQSTGICPACRWDPLLKSEQQTEDPELELSLTERYRGTQFDAHPEMAVQHTAPVSRGRTFVLIGLLAAAGLYGVVLAMSGLF